jgi:hypothetical protein
MTIEKRKLKTRVKGIPFAFLTEEMPLTKEFSPLMPLKSCAISKSINEAAGDLK